MTAAQQRVVRQCIETEIAAVEHDLARRQPQRDHWDKPINVGGDARERHLVICREALYEVNRIKVT